MSVFANSTYDSTTSVGFEEVAAVVHHRIDVARGNELKHLDLAAAFLRQRGDVLVGDHHRLAVIGFEGLRDVAVLDDLAAHLADALVADASVVLRMDLVELDVWSSVAL